MTEVLDPGSLVGAGAATAPHPALPVSQVTPAAADPVAGYHFTVVPHTHWDREWYLPFEVMRIRLARTVEEICDVLEADPRFTSFTLDGQAVILEDVVELRPDLEPRLRGLLAAGRLATGPGYVLPDEFLSGQESLVRNFLAGRATCERFGARPMAVGYLPDTFGHVAQLPQVLRGFGLDTFVFWRGLGDEGNRLGLAFTWEAPDGSPVTAIRQLGSYGNACQVGRWAAGGVDLAERPDRMAETAAARFGRFVTAFAAELERTPTRELFLCNGADHEPIHRPLPDLLEHAASVHPGTTFAIGSYEDYRARVLPTLEGLPVVRGELVGGRDAPVLRGINSARMSLKQAAERAERDLLAAETLAALAVLAGAASYPAAELDRAWRRHLENLPHDSISGCSVDETHRDMLPRWTTVERITGRIRREALAALAGRVEPWSYRPRREPAVSVVNVLGHARRGLAEIVLPEELVDARALVAVDADGGVRAVQLADGRALVLVDLPGFGAADLRLEPEEGGAGAVDRSAAGAAEPLPGVTPARALGPDTIGNGLVSVTVDALARMTVCHEATGRTWGDLHRFEDVADRGDEYTFCPVEGDEQRCAELPGTVRVVADGPLVAELEVSLVLRLPARLSADRRRREGLVDVPITSRARVTAGSARVEITTTVDNAAEDHRLRVRFNAAGATNASIVRAEGHFGVVRRTTRPIWTGSGWTEPPAMTAHTAGFVAAGELVLFGRGLPEYEAIPTRDGLDLALTLLRCVGWLSRDDLATRPGGAGPTLPTPEAQCPGRHVFEYALAIETAAGDAAVTDTALLRASADYRTPAIVGPAGVRTGGLVAVDGDVMVTALKGAEDGDGAILRLVAAGAEAGEGSAVVIQAVGQVTRARLDETPEDGLPDAPLRSAEIRTLRLRAD